MSGSAARRKGEVGGVRPRTRAQVAREAKRERVGGAVKNAGKSISPIPLFFPLSFFYYYYYFGPMDILFRRSDEGGFSLGFSFFFYFPPYAEVWVSLLIGFR